MAGDSEKVRFTLRLNSRDFDRFNYWAEKADMSPHEFFVAVLDRYIAVANGDYPLATMETNRINDMAEAVVDLSHRFHLMETNMVSSCDALSNLIRSNNSFLERNDDEF